MQCEPSTTHSCESSRAPKKSAKIAKNRSLEKRWHTKLNFLADHVSRKYGKGTQITQLADPYSVILLVVSF